MATPNDIPQPQVLMPQTLQRQAAERSDKSEALALDIIRIVAPAVIAAAPKEMPGNILGDHTAAVCERLWLWATSDTWPPKVEK